MLYPPDIIWYTQSKDDTEWDVVVDGEILKDDKQHYVDLARMGVSIPPSDNGKWYGFSRNKEIVRGYLIPDRKGPRGRYRSGVFYVQTGNKDNASVVESVLISLRKLGVEISETRIEEFKKVFSAFLEKGNYMPLRTVIGVGAAIGAGLIAGVYWIRKKFRSGNTETKRDVQEDENDKRM